MIGMSTRAFLLHSVNFCLHGWYFALGFGQLVCSVQCILLRGQLLGEDVFLPLQGLELEAHDGELILVGPRRFCNFGCSIGWLVVLWWGVVWKIVPGRFGNHFGCRSQEGLWVSSCVVPSRVGLRAGNTVGALVGFSASLLPNQNAYTKVKQIKMAEFRPHICTCPVQIGWGYLYP